MEPQDLLFGIDLGGTKIEAVAITPTGRVLSRPRIPTEREKGYDHIVGQIKKALELVSAEVGVAAKKVGIGTPGAIDPPTNLMKNSNTTVLNGRPFHIDVEKALGIPVVMANDANCFAVAEAKLGAAKAYTQGEHIVFGVIMGTGVGGGIVAVSPGKFGIAAISPPLDEVGNSVRAQKAIADISAALGGNPYQVMPYKK